MGEILGSRAVTTADILCPDCKDSIKVHHPRGCSATHRVGTPPPRKLRLGAGEVARQRYSTAMRAAYRPCHCWRPPEAILDPERFAPKLRPGDRVRAIACPELTGVVKHYEYCETWLSPIPYCIGWDDSDRACRLLGFLFVYASDSSVEAIA